MNERVILKSVFDPFWWNDDVDIYFSGIYKAHNVDDIDGSFFCCSIFVYTIYILDTSCKENLFCTYHYMIRRKKWWKKFMYSISNLHEAQQQEKNNTSSCVLCFQIEEKTWDNIAFIKVFSSIPFLRISRVNLKTAQFCHYFHYKHFISSVSVVWSNNIYLHIRLILLFFYLFYYISIYIV